MRILRRLLRWAGLLVLGVLVVPIVSEYAVRYAEQRGAYEDPSHWFNIVIGGAAMLPSQPWFWPVFAFVFGATTAWWTDWYLRGRERSVEESARRLGIDLAQFSNKMKNTASESVLQRGQAPTFDTAKVLSFRSTMRALRIPFPTHIEDEPDKIVRYFSYMRFFHFVSTFLIAGQLKEARRYAANMRKPHSVNSEADG